VTSAATDTLVPAAGVMLRGGGERGGGHRADVGEDVSAMESDVRQPPHVGGAGRRRMK
jgi:hypothetical protein